MGLSKREAIATSRSATRRRAVLSSGLPYLPRSLGHHLPYVVDVGANEGQWLSALLRFVTVDRVDALEPNPLTFRRLQANFRDRPQVSCHELAAGERRESLTMHASLQSEFSSFLRASAVVAREYGNRAADVTEHFEVPVLPLDEALAGNQPIDLLKIDVEGFQRSVLAGARHTLSRTRVVMMETYFVSHFAGDETFAGLNRLMTEVHGFQFWNMALPVYGSSGRAMWADAVFVNPALGPAGGWEGANLDSVVTNEFLYKTASL
jgi:FkbM family methyltransferase